MSASPVAYALTLLTARIAGLLDPRRDRSVPPGAAHRAVLAALSLVLAAASAGVGPGPRVPSGKPPADALAQADANRIRIPAAALDADGVVRELAARSANWVAPPAALETLEYDFISSPQVTPVKVTRGERRRPAYGWARRSTPDSTS